MASKMNDCPVCYDLCAKLSVTCCNGHSICEKHYLQRYKAIYEEGRMAFSDNHAQCCFMCRSHIEDSRFSKIYFDLLKMVVTQGILNKSGINTSANFHKVLEARKANLSEEDESEEDESEEGESEEDE